MMRFLLDDELLSGAYDAATSLRPQRTVRCVDQGDPAAVVSMMAYLCQVWGGHAHPIVPVTDLTVPEPYLRCLYGDQYDIVDRRVPEEPALDLPKRIKQARAWDHPAIIVAAHQRRDRWRTIEVAELEADDPWAPVYAATLGVLPRQIDANLREFAGLRDDLAFDEIIPVRYTSVTGSLHDLIERLMKADVLSPRQLAGNSLATGLEPDTSFLGDSPLLPSPYHERRAAAPNIIVVIFACAGPLCRVVRSRGHRDCASVTCMARLIARGLGERVETAVCERELATVAGVDGSFGTGGQW